MDISKLRKKHKEARDKRGPEAPEAKPDEKGEHEEPSSDVVEEHPEASVDEELLLDEEVLEEEQPYPVTVQEETKKAQEPATEAPSGAETAFAEIAELLVFKLAGELYAFRVTEVAEVLRPHLVTSVPRTVDFIPGVTSLRGKIIPVMDLRKRLQIGNSSTDKPSNIVILKGVGRGLIGVLVDKTLDVIRVPEEEIMQPPSHLGENEARFIEGVVAQEESFVSIIQPEELLDFNAEDVR